MPFPFTSLLVENMRVRNFRMFDGLPTKSGVTMSIQASGTHYSTPREILPAEDYLEFELSLIRPDEGLIHPDSIPQLNGRFGDCFESGGSPVASYLSADVVQEIYDILNT